MARRSARARIRQLAFALTAFDQSRKKNLKPIFAALRAKAGLELSHAVRIDIDHVEARI
jgi:hypothetical protein